MNYLDASNITPGTISKIDGHYRICKVVAINVKGQRGEYECKLRWHLPKTSKDIKAVRRLERELRGLG